MTRELRTDACCIWSVLTVRNGRRKARTRVTETPTNTRITRNSDASSERRTAPVTIAITASRTADSAAPVRTFLIVMASPKRVRMSPTGRESKKRNGSR
jgi:hypothetical protein